MDPKETLQGDRGNIKLSETEMPEEEGAGHRDSEMP